MPALTISAVDHTTGHITVTAHGRSNGDGPAALFAASSSAAIPTGWAGVTDYWLIVLDANTVKLADSSAHALAGTAIANPSDNGTLPLELLIGLPYRVPMTAAAGMQIKSANDNSVWIVLVALWNFLTGQAQSIWNGIVLAANQNLKLQGAGYVQHDNWTSLNPFTPGGDWQVAGGAPPAWVLAGSAGVQVPAASDVYYPLRIPTDKDRLQGVTVWARAFVGACTMSLYQSNGIGSATESLNVMTLTGGGTTLSVPADGLWNPRTLTLQTPTKLTAGENLFLRVVTPAGDTVDLLTYGVVADAP